MSSDQTDAATPVVDEAQTCPVRDVDDFLADLDNVLATSIAPTTIPAPTAEPAPEQDAAAVPDGELDLEEPPVPAPIPAVVPVPTAAPEQDRDWWDPLYRDDKADQDTFTGNAPPTVPPPTAPPEPTHAPNVPAAQDDIEEVDDDGNDQDEDNDGAGPEAPKRARYRLKGKIRPDDALGYDVDDEAPARSTKAGTTAVAAGDGLINNPRGRQVIFAGTAAGLGWGLHLNDVATTLMTNAAQYALPVAGFALWAGLFGLATHSRFGVAVFIASLGLVATLGMASPADVVGGGLALGLQIAYRLVRIGVGRHRANWPWKGVVWLAHVPAATATLAFIQHGTN